MRPCSVRYLADACGGTVTGDSGYLVRDIKIDSRACGDGDLFVCVIGEINDGHNFVRSAYDNGCRAFLVSRDVELPEDAVLIHTDDTMQAFRHMAETYLAQFNVRKIGVTGSVGKTTTKMLTAAVASAKYRTICSQKNLNTHLGVCLTCFLADETTECVVFEMGMDHKGEIEEYIEWTKPEIAIITNIGISHMERLGSRDAIADAKLEIVLQFNDDCVLVVNSRSDYLKTEEEIRARALNKSNFKIVMLGRDIDFRDVRNLGEDGIEFYVGDVKVELPLLGEHNAIDACLAIAAGWQLGISTEEAAEALGKVTATERRLKAAKVGEVYLLDDSYNASPDSMKAGIAALCGVDAKRRIAVLGDMLELGGADEEGHTAVGEYAAEKGVDILIATGKRKEYYFKGVSRSGKTGTSTIGLEDLDSVKDMVLQILRPGDAVLVKGSNSTGLGQVAELIRTSEEKWKRS